MSTHRRIQLLAILTLIAKEQQGLCNESYIKSSDAASGPRYSHPGLIAGGDENPGLPLPETPPEAPTNFSASASCDSTVIVTWSYSDESATSFSLQMCMAGITTCQKASVARDNRAYTFHVGPTENTYQLSMWASRKDATRSVNSTTVAANVTTFPYVPLVDSAVVRALTSSALQITWTTEWKYQIRIAVCPLEGPKRRCNDYIVDGDKYVFTITGLNARTLYEVDTTAQATRYGMTCVGPVFEQDVTTFSMDIGPVRNLNHTLVNVTVISATWDEPAIAERIDGYTMTCKNEANGQSRTAEYHRSENMSVLLDVKEQLAHLNCSVNAFATWDSGRQEGLATVFEEATGGIAAPREVILTNSTKTSLTYSWLADPGATKFRIHVRAVCNVCSARDITELLDMKVEAVFVEHTILHLNPGTLYDVFIQNCADYCGLSTVVRNTTDVGAPSPVREIQSNLRGFSDVTLTWTRPQMPNGPIDGYIVKLFNEENNKTDVHTVDGKTERLSLQLRDHFTYFKAHISAYNIDHADNLTLFGVEEEIVFVTLGDGPFPPFPEVETIGERQATLFWKFPIDPRYNITHFCVSLNGSMSSFTSANSYTAVKLLPYQVYAVYVSSCTSTMCGEKRSAHFFTDVGIPSLPRSLTVHSLGTTWIDVKWQRPKAPNGPVSGYNITWSDGNHAITTTTNETAFNITLLKPGSLYRISVHAFNDGRRRRKPGPSSVINVSTDQQETPSRTTSTFAIAVSFMALLMVILIGSAYATVKIIIRRKRALLVDEFDCHPLVSEEMAPPPRKHTLNCWSSKV